MSGAKEPRLPHLYGLSLFEYDVLGLVVPGVLFILLLYVLCTFLGAPPTSWSAWLTGTTDWWKGLLGATTMVLIAYAIGLLTDSLTGALLVDLFARKLWRRSTLPLTWDDACLRYTQSGTTRNEYINVYRAHIQARCLANLGLLCASLGVAGLLSAVFRDNYLRAAEVSIACLFLGAALLVSSYWREFRRVWGVDLAYRLSSPPSGSNADKQNPQAASMPTYGCRSLLVRIIVLVAVILVIMRMVIVMLEC